MDRKQKVSIVMGSDSDLPVLKGCIKMLEKFGIDNEVMVCSAHRTPDMAANFAKNAEDNGIDVIIAAAGKAAHLAGVIAANTPLPVIGIPIKSSTLDGLDSLLSTVQMPSGIPVATVAIDGAENAAILAVQILSVANPKLREEIKKYKTELKDKVEEKNRNILEKIKEFK